MKDIDDFYYDLANRERNIEINRKESLETNAQRFATFGGIFISVLTTYFFFIFENSMNKPISLYIKVTLFLAIISFGISTFLLLYSMKTRHDPTLEVDKLITKIKKLEVDFTEARKGIIGSINRITRITRAVNNRKAKFLSFGIVTFLISLIIMILGILFSILIF